MGMAVDLPEEANPGATRTPSISGLVRLGTMTDSFRYVNNDEDSVCHLTRGPRNGPNMAV